MLTRFSHLMGLSGSLLVLISSGCATDRSQQSTHVSNRARIGNSAIARTSQSSDDSVSRRSVAIQRVPATHQIEQTAFEDPKLSADRDSDPSSAPPNSIPEDETTPTSTVPLNDVATEGTPEYRYPLDLPTALLLTTGQNNQVAFAQARIAEAQAQVDRADAMWLPSLRVGANYNKHEGQIQDVAGNIINTSRGALYTGLGANAVGAGSPAVPGLVANFHLTDAIFQPRAARNAASARSWEARATTNNELYATALVYLELLKAQQERAISLDIRDRSEKLVQLTQDYAKSGQGLQSDNDRAKTELTLRENEVQRADEQIRVISVRLAERLRLDPFMKLEPQEAVIVPIEMVPANVTVHELVAQGLSGRPEICESRSLVSEAVERLKREEYAPLIPSVLLGMSYGGFGGGLGGNISDFGNRLDGDAVAYWELRNFGAGERSARGEANSRLEQARLKEVIALDRVAREVIEAQAQTESRRKQIVMAEQGIQAALSSYDHNLERIQNAQGLPIEVLQSIQALAAARREYLRVLIDYNVSQFTLHRAIGWPGQLGGS